MYVSEDNMESDYVPISDFYAGRSVFITGGTGFVGKVIIEKLLYSCPLIENIYLLLRKKKNKNTDERTMLLVDDPIFSRLKSERAEDLNKIIFVEGDLTGENLGIDAAYVKIILEKVSVVIHSAATLSFDDPLPKAIKINFEGTKKVLELCRRLKKIKGFVYVSTAYSYTNDKVIDEVIYPSPFKLSSINDLLKDFDEGKIDIQEILGDRPNTYTLTKALAEAYVSENHGNIPTSIVRPSVVTSILKEPLVGWVDKWNFMNAQMVFLIKNVMRTAQGSGHEIFDIIPVDIVSNLIIVAAARCEESKHVNVYSCCTSSTNPITVKQIIDLVYKNNNNNGTNLSKIFGIVYVKTVWLALLITFLLQTLPAFIADCALFLMGKPTRFVKLNSKVLNLQKNSSFFTSHSWKMLTKNSQRLADTLSTEDRNKFYTDTKLIDWDRYIVTYIDGIKKYLLEKQI